MPRHVYVAYMLVLVVLGTPGFMLDMAWWAAAGVGVAAMIPIVVVDIVISRRRDSAPQRTG
jgi:hypothetical protein